MAADLSCMRLHVMPGPVPHTDDAYAGRAFLVKVNANIGNSAVSSSIEEVQTAQFFPA